MQPILSICIPTYNRQKFLKETLACLMPQLNEKVEVIVFDNHSTDKTHDYLKSIEGLIKFFRQESNVGADRNMSDCVRGGEGKYIWLLCDDDLPYSNCIAKISEGIEKYSEPPFFFLKWRVSDSTVSDYDSQPYQDDWFLCNRDEFLKVVGVWCTFASSLIARRDCLDLNFIESRIGTFLVPAAITLSTVGLCNSAYVSDKPLIFVRGENSGGYSALNIFTKELSSLLKISKIFGYSRNALNHA